jgi:hypothetical protein
MGEYDMPYMIWHVRYAMGDKSWEIKHVGNGGYTMM